MSLLIGSKLVREDWKIGRVVAEDQGWPFQILVNGHVDNQWLLLRTDRNPRGCLKSHDSSRQTDVVKRIR